MQKLFYLLRDGRNPDGDALRRTLCGQAAARMRESGAREITIFASDSDSEGNYYVLASATGEVIEVDADAGTFETVVTVEGAPFDNIAFASDDTLYISHFTTPQITAVDPDGAVSVIDVGAAG